MDIFPLPVVIMAIKTEFPLFQQFKFMFADFVMAPGTVIFSREMHIFQFLKFRMTIRGGAVVTIGR